MGEDPSGLGEDDPPVGSMLDPGPGGNQAIGPVGEGPGFPIVVGEGKAPAHFDAVDAEPIEDVLVHNRELLDHVVDANGSGLQPEIRAELRIYDSGNS